MSNKNYGIAAGFIVDSLGRVGDFTSIQDAINAATNYNTNIDVLINPGTYIEDLTMSPTINLVGLPGDSDNPNVAITGKITYTGAGSVSISNISLSNSGDYFLSVSDFNGSVVTLNNCSLNPTDNAGISNSDSGIIYLNYCTGTLNEALFNHSSSGDIRFNYCNFLSSGATASTVSDGFVYSKYSNLPFPVTTSSSGNLQFMYTSMDLSDDNATCITLGDATVGTFDKCYFSSGTASAISLGENATLTINDSEVSSSNANAIAESAAAFINYSNLTFINTSSIVNVTNQTIFPVGPRILLSGGCQLLSGTGSPNTVVTAPQGSLFLRTDGSSTITRAYINTDGSTAWTPLTTVA